MAHRVRRSHRRRTRRTRHRGGSYFTGSSTGSAYVSPGNLVIQPNHQAGGPDCLASSRTGEIPRTDYGGLPGMRGGRFTSSLPASVISEGRGLVATPAQAIRLPCESSMTTQNPLNLRGGGGDPSRMDVGSAAGMSAYHAPTAGYGVQMSQGGSTPLMLHVPYAAKSCISTGGRRRSSVRFRKHSRRHKGNRKHKHRHRHRTHRRP